MPIKKVTIEIHTDPRKRQRVPVPPGERPHTTDKRKAESLRKQKHKQPPATQE